MAGKRATVRDIAREAGVSVAAVSRDNNQNGRFSKATEQRVRAAIKKFDYRPNQMAKGLRQDRTSAIGVVVPNISNEFFSTLILSLQERFFEAGYSLSIYNTNHCAQMERASHAQLAAQRVSGVVCSNPTVDVRGALDSSVPVVLIDAAPESQRAALERGSACAFVCSDNRESGRLAADELVSGGCRSLALVSATRHDPVGTRRTESFETELGRRGLALDPRLVVCPKATGFDEGYAATERLLAGDVPFDGMFCQTDRLAMGALEALRDHGLHVPEDVAVVGHDDILIARFGRPPLTTVRQNPLLMGERAASLMLAMIAGEEGACGSCETVPVELVPRASSRRSCC